MTGEYLYWHDIVLGVLFLTLLAFFLNNYVFDRKRKKNAFQLVEEFKSLYWLFYTVLIVIAVIFIILAWTGVI